MRRDRELRRSALVVLLLLALASPASGASAPRPRADVEVHSSPGSIALAGNWSIGKFMASGGRTRIVQMCAVVMCLALFIMMRKLH